jgi:N-acetylglucosaminyldiphosphoundecaprenol N-acetyl-beta-D-mannosaminyltransferase
MTELTVSETRPEAQHSHQRVPLGLLFADRLTATQAIDLIVSRARSGLGGYVVTPNVDHVCVAVENEAFRVAHRAAYLSLVDGTPLMWLASLSGQSLPEKVSGSDLVVPVAERASREGLRVALFGASPETSQLAHDELLKRFPALTIVARETPMYAPGCRSPESDKELEGAITRTLDAQPDLVFVAMGTPNQELFMSEFCDRFSALLLGIGAGLDFVAGKKVRAPKWAQTLGVEWLVRLVQEPRRMWRRYLVRDMKFFSIAPRQILRMRLKKPL